MPESKPVWRQIVEALPEPIAVADTHGRIVAMNPAFRRVVEPCALRDRVWLDKSGGLIILAGTDAGTSISGMYKLAAPQGVCFESHRLEDGVGLIALIGRVA